MSFFSSYSVDNDKKFIKLIDESLKVVDDLSLEFGLIANDFYTSQIATFKNKPGRYPDYTDTTTGETGENTPYARRKKKETGSAYPMLVFTGRLSRSLMEPDAPNKDSILVIGKKSLSIGTKVPYGVFHQSDKPRKKMPLRKFLFIGPEANQFADNDQRGRPQRWNDIMKKTLVQRLKKKQQGL